MPRLKLSSLVLVILLLSPLSYGRTKLVKIVSSFDTPGYNEYDAQKNPTGFEMDLATAVFKSQGYKIQWQEMQWDGIVAALAQPTANTNLDYIMIASIEASPERRRNWNFPRPVEFDASHYFFTQADVKPKTGAVVDTLTHQKVDGFILDIPENRIGGKKLRIAAWKDSAFANELERVYPSPQNIEIVLKENGNPMDWLKTEAMDAVYAFASGPKNAYTAEGFNIVGGPITNFILDDLGGSAPAMPDNNFGHSMEIVWQKGMAALLRDDTFFNISKKWFGRVSWAFELNEDWLAQNKIDAADLRRRIRAFEQRSAHPRRAR